MKKRVWIVGILLVLSLIGIVSAYSNLSDYYNSIDYSCTQNLDCEIKDVSNCCGYYPECVNKNAIVNSTFVMEECQKEALGGACGFPSINTCKCENNLCVGHYENTNDCTDSDGGIDYYVSGNTCIEDICSSDYCQSPAYLMEFSCSNGRVVETREQCPEGYICENIDKNEGKNGRCIETDQTKQGCVDSDDGKKEFVRGHVVINNERHDDYCYDGNNLIESFCSYSDIIKEEIADKVMIGCINGCRDGLCIKESEEPGEEKPIEIPEESEEEFIYICNGCLLDKKCYPFGYRESGEYCSDSNEFVFQLEAGAVCDNNFECDSNVCVDGECISGSLLRKILDWFKRLFGFGQDK